MLVKPVLDYLEESRKKIIGNDDSFLDELAKNINILFSIDPVLNKKNLEKILSNPDSDSLKEALREKGFQQMDLARCLIDYVNVMYGSSVSESLLENVFEPLINEGLSNSMPGLKRVKVLKDSFMNYYVLKESRTGHVSCKYLSLWDNSIVCHDKFKVDWLNDDFDLLEEISLQEINSSNIGMNSVWQSKDAMAYNYKHPLIENQSIVHEIIMDNSPEEFKWVDKIIKNSPVSYVVKALNYIKKAEQEAFWNLVSAINGLMDRKNIIPYAKNTIINYFIREQDYL